MAVGRPIVSGNAQPGISIIHSTQYTARSTITSRVVKVASDGYIKTPPHKPNIDAPQRTARRRVLMALECGGVTHNLDLPPPIRLSPFLCPPHGQLCAKQDTDRGEVNDAHMYVPYLYASTLAHPMVTRSAGSDLPLVCMPSHLLISIMSNVENRERDEHQTHKCAACG